jgi:hypothetical protein
MPADLRDARKLIAKQRGNTITWYDAETLEFAGEVTLPEHFTMADVEAFIEHLKKEAAKAGEKPS